MIARPGAPTVRLAAAPAPRPWPTLSPSQRAVVDRRDPALLVLGAPGSGRTTTALALVADRLATGTLGSQVLLLAPTRRAATRLRDDLTAHLPPGTIPPAVRTPAALAFAVLRARAALDAEPTPVLLSGPEQDLELGELLAGHAAGDVPGPDWGPRVPAEARGLRGFRDELRNLLMRAAERGLTPADLAVLGERHGRPEWAAAAAVYAEYLDVLDLGTTTPDRGRRYDPAAVVDVAADVLQEWRAADDAGDRGSRRPRWRLVVVDDHQESTVATARLLGVLAADGADLVLFADPDITVQGFRGAEPRLVARAGVAPGDEPGTFGARTVVLPEVLRHGAEVRAVVAAVSALVRGPDRAHRAAGPVPDAPAGDVAVCRFDSPAQEVAAVALALRHAHLHGPVTWDRMAVIARGGRQVAALRRALAAAGVPVTVEGSDVALPAEPAVRPLLHALGCVIRPGGFAEAVTAADVAELLTSPIGGLDAVGLRRLRRTLRAEELASGGGRVSDALLTEVVADPARITLLPGAQRGPVARVARVLAAGRAAGAVPGATALDVIWAVWDATDLAGPWRDAALAGGAGGARADADLDAVLALFKAAERFVDRMPGAPPVAFLDHLRSQELPGDVLAAHGDVGPAVALLTPPGAAGREWDLVVVAGVQEGAWPDLRLRDSLLGAQDLVDVVAGRGLRAAGPEGYAEARAAVLDDELRSFAVAVSRARRALLVTAVADADTQPSPLLDIVPPTPVLTLLPAAFAAPDQATVAVPAALDLRSVVAQARALAERAEPGAVDLLAGLAAAGRVEADPTSWYGVGDLSTDAPLRGPEERVPLSPSRLQQLEDCSLRWALEAAGGTRAGSFEQNVGLLVHEIAAAHPAGSAEELLAELERRWPELGLGTGWVAQVEHRRAQDMVRKLAAYLAGAAPVEAVEARFEVAMGRAVLRGGVDRVERVEAEDGTVGLRIVDLKTGKTPITAAEAETNLQLVAYQLAVEAGALPGPAGPAPSAGAELVYVGTGTIGWSGRHQPSLADPARRAAAEERVAALVEVASGATVSAVVNPACGTCPVRRACPLQPEGRTVGVDRG